MRHEEVEAKGVQQLYLWQGWVVAIFVDARTTYHFAMLKQWSNCVGIGEAVTPLTTCPSEEIFMVLVLVAVEIVRVHFCVPRYENTKFKY